MDEEKSYKYHTSVYLTEYHRGLLIKAGMFQKLSQWVRQQIEEHFGNYDLNDIKKQKEQELIEIASQYNSLKKDIESIKLQIKERQEIEKKYKHFNKDQIEFIKQARQAKKESSFNKISWVMEFRSRFGKSISAEEVMKAIEE